MAGGTTDVPAGVTGTIASSPGRRKTALGAWAQSHALAVAVFGLAAVAVAVLVTVPLVDGRPLIGYTADDAYISFRYSDNLAHGHGPVWNLVGPRTDGYTSALWMAIVALPVAVGADPVVAAKVIGLLAAAGIVALLAFADGPRALLARVAAIGALVLSPAFLTLTVQGMETTAAAALAAVCAWLLVLALRSPSHRLLAGFSVAALLALLARPDLAPFAGVCVLALLVRLAREGDRAALKRAAAWIAGALVIPILAWALWRWSYYGYPLPNTAYAKRSDQLVDPQARHLLKTFVTSFAWPYLLAIAVLAVRAASPARRAADPAGTWAIGAGLLGSVLFLAAGLLFSPIQGDLWRFQMPVFPVLLLCGVLLAARDPLVADLGFRGGGLRRAVPLLAALTLAAFALTTVGDTRFEVRGRWVHDRLQAGKALAQFSDDGMSMFVTESGALPLYAGWRTSDLLGLNDHYIAQHGATPAYVASLHPDLLQFVAQPGHRPGPAYDAFRQLLRTGSYEFAVATVKTNDDLRPGVPAQDHFFFVRRGAPRAGDVLAALRGLTDVRRVAPAPAAATLRSMDYRNLPH